ncbi:hypothetical protein QCA50_018674 [Cerrena zonata]|uniref:Required for respiratory growth protein 9, mitochondrial n=1 Tax=Cerrena zonata TaxID=2478898 RepID=A0AAW0FCP1_9APHY
MTSLLTKITRTVPTRSPARHSYLAFYSTVSGLFGNKWNISGKAPISLRESEEINADVEVEEGAIPVSLPKKAIRNPTPTQWANHHKTLKERFPDGWSPPRKLSRDAMDGLRSLHAANPELFTTPVLAEKFRISPEAVRRILKSKWHPSQEKRVRLLERERQSREDFIAKRRQEEWEMQKALDGQHDEYSRQKSYRGVDKDDKLEFV